MFATPRLVGRLFCCLRIQSRTPRNRADQYDPFLLQIQLARVIVRPLYVSPVCALRIGRQDIVMTPADRLPNFCTPHRARPMPKAGPPRVCNPFSFKNGGGYHVQRNASMSKKTPTCRKIATSDQMRTTTLCDPLK